jgi:hypothetical protein
MGGVFGPNMMARPSWAQRRFERKHSGLHRGIFVAALISLAVWSVLLALIV